MSTLQVWDSIRLKEYNMREVRNKNWYLVIILPKDYDSISSGFVYLTLQ